MFKSDISIEEMNAYGYTYEQMIPINEEVALDLFRQGAAIYLLYEDDTEGMAMDEEEITNFTGLLGIEIEDLKAMGLWD